MNGTYKCCMTQRFKGGINRRYGKMTLVNNNGVLSGSMFPTMFWLNSSFSYGKCDGKNFSFTAHWGTPCQQFSMDVEGIAENGKITGKVFSPMGEYELTGCIDE